MKDHIFVVCTLIPEMTFLTPQKILNYVLVAQIIP